MGDRLLGEKPLFVLHEADWSTYDFAEKLYIDTMKPLLMRIDAWDEEDLIAKFKQSFKPEEVRIIRVGGVDAGWLQIAETSDDINLSQIHILEEFRSLGFGSQLIRDLLDEARAKNKTVSLSVVHHNPATSLYLRFGFKVVAEDRVKQHLRWEPSGTEGTEGT